MFSRLSDGVEPQIRNARVVVGVVIREQRGMLAELGRLVSRYAFWFRF